MRLDFVWIDTEHNAMSLERVQGHIMATKGSEVVPLVRVPANDPVLIKPVLDIGAAGVIVPLVKTAADACAWPFQHAGIRRMEFGGLARVVPRGSVPAAVPIFAKRPTNRSSPSCRSNRPRRWRTSPRSWPYRGWPRSSWGQRFGQLAGIRRAAVQPRCCAIDTVIAKVRAAKVPMGIAVGDDPEVIVEWANKGVNWIAIAADYGLLVRSAMQLAGRVREHLHGKT